MDDLAAAFGGPVLKVVAAAVGLYALVAAGKGSLPPWSLDSPLLDQLCAEGGVAPATAETVRALAAELTGDLAVYRADYQTAYPKGLPVGHQARYAYNPLARFPLVAIPDGRVVAPAPRWILRRVAPSGLYYAGVRRFRNRFSDDFGPVVERYVGLNLDLIAGAEVHPEIVYPTANGEAKSVDWIVVLETAVLLVEAKAARVVIGPRTGSDSLVEDLATRLDEAAKQINTTEELIRSRHPAFAHLPADRPTVGLVVTAEPFYTANNRDLRAALEHSTDRTLFASLRRLERLVLYPGDVLGPALLQISTDDDLSNWMLTSSLTNVLGAAPVDETPMLAAARAAVFLQDTDDAVTG